MNHKDFDKLVERETTRMIDVMCSKSEDYADNENDDKLFNFKLAAELDDISPIEALRGMWLKHRTSIRQGLDELMDGKCRPKEWWIEKLTDDRNYNILLQALLEEKYFSFVVPEGWRIVNFSNCGWYVFNNYEGLHLHKDLRLHNGTGYFGGSGAPGYWPTKEAAEDCLKQYLEVNHE